MPEHDKDEQPFTDPKLTVIPGTPEFIQTRGSNVDDPPDLNKHVHFGPPDDEPKPKKSKD